MSIIQELYFNDPKISLYTESAQKGLNIYIQSQIQLSLLTHIAVLVKDTDNANKLFRLLTIETRRQESEEFEPVHECSIPGVDPQFEFKQEGSQVILPCVGVAYAIRLSFTTEISDDEDEMQDLSQLSRSLTEENIEQQNFGGESNPVFIQNAFLDCYGAIGLIGYSLNSSPPASQVVTLLNTAAILRNYPEGGFADFLVGLSLMNARRFVQAAEFIRRAESRLVGNIDIPLRSPRPLGSPPFKAPAATTNKRLLKAAKFELIVAEGFNQHGQILDKLFAYQKATEYFLGGTELDAVSLDSDVYTSLINLQPHLGRLLMRNLADKLEPLKISSVRGLEFLLEHLGCSLNSQMPLMLKAIIKSHPNISGQLPSDSFSSSLISSTSIQELQKDEPSIVLIDAYSRLLETFLSVLSSASPQLLYQIFHDVIAQHIMIQDLPKELRCYLLRFADRITNICEGDLDYSPNLIGGILQLRFYDECAEYANTLWDTIKLKILPFYRAQKLENLVSWIYEFLSGETEEQELSIILEIIQIISQREPNQGSIRQQRKPKPELRPLLTPLLHWLDYAAASQDRLNLFTQLWTCLTYIAQHFVELNLFKFISPLLYKTKDYCHMGSPPLPMLRFLQTVLPDMRIDQAYYDFLVEFLPAFCSCVPSNVIDETFSVLNILISLLNNNMTEDLIICIINALLDQYTIKSQQQRTSKNHLKNIILNNPFYLTTSMFYLLIKNHEKWIDPDKYDKQRIVLEHDSFVERISFGIDILSQVDQESSSHIFDLLPDISQCCSRFLLNKDSNVRIRGLEILRLLGELSLATQGEECLIVSNMILELVQQPLQQGNDAKSVFYSLQLIDLVFKHLMPSKVIDSEYQEMRIVEALKLWGSLQNLLQSPWSNIRAISFAILCSWIQVNLSQLRLSVQQKLKANLQPLLHSLLSSRASESRAGALNILGSFCGLNVDESTAINLDQFRTHSEFIPLPIWDLVYHLQEDWDSMIREAASVLIQLCAPRDAVAHFYKVEREELSLKLLGHLQEEDEMEYLPEQEQEIFWIDNCSMLEVRDIISMFKTDSQNPSQLWNEQREVQNVEHLVDTTEESKIDEEEESLEQLGVIDIEDEELLEGYDDDQSKYPVIKNTYAKRKGQYRPTQDIGSEENNWSRTLRPHNASMRPCTPPAKSQQEESDMPRQRPVSRNDIREEEKEPDIPNNSCSPILGSVPEFDYEEIVQGHKRKGSLDDLKDLLEEKEEKESPRTPRARQIELQGKSRGATSATALGKIYLQKPDLSLFRKRGKVEGLGRGRKGPIKLTSDLQ